MIRFSTKPIMVFTSDAAIPVPNAMAVPRSATPTEAAETTRPATRFKIEPTTVTAVEARGPTTGNRFNTVDTVLTRDLSKGKSDSKIDTMEFRGEVKVLAAPASAVTMLDTGERIALMRGLIMLRAITIGVDRSGIVLVAILARLGIIAPNVDASDDKVVARVFVRVEIGSVAFELH